MDKDTTIHVRFTAENKERLDKAVLQWLKDNNPKGSKADVHRMVLLGWVDEQEQGEK